MPMISVWAEGYRATGESGRATRLGVVEADSFKEAVEKLAENPALARDLNVERMTYWGCRLFESKSAAKKSFG